MSPTRRAEKPLLLPDTPNPGAHVTVLGYTMLTTTAFEYADAELKKNRPVAGIVQASGSQQGLVAVTIAHVGVDSVIQGAKGSDWAGVATERQLRLRGVDTSLMVPTGPAAQVVTTLEHGNPEQWYGLSIGGAMNAPASALDKSGIAKSSCVYASLYSIAYHDQLGIAGLRHARDCGVPSVIDLASPNAIAMFGRDEMIGALADLNPGVLVGNADEFSAIGVNAASPSCKKPEWCEIAIIHRFDSSVLILGNREPEEIRFRPIKRWTSRVGVQQESAIFDPTGAGDVFAALIAVGVAKQMEATSAAARARALATRSIQDAGPGLGGLANLTLETLA